MTISEKFEKELLEFIKWAPEFGLIIKKGVVEKKWCNISINKNYEEPGRNKLSMYIQDNILSEYIIEYEEKKIEDVKSVVKFFKEGSKKVKSVKVKSVKVESVKVKSVKVESIKVKSAKVESVKKAKVEGVKKEKDDRQKVDILKFINENEKNDMDRETFRDEKKRVEIMEEVKVNVEEGVYKFPELNFELN